MMDKSEKSQDDRDTARKNLNSSKSDHTENKNTFWKSANAFFKGISLVEYRTPLYFANKDSYKSGTSGFLTILCGLTLAFVFLYIFVPIFRKDTLKLETNQIDIRNERKEYNGRVAEDCSSCRDFTL
jgi:hypothetical protein